MDCVISSYLVSAIEVRIGGWSGEILQAQDQVALIWVRDCSPWLRMSTRTRQLAVPFSPGKTRKIFMWGSMEPSSGRSLFRVSARAAIPDVLLSAKAGGRRTRKRPSSKVSDRFSGRRGVVDTSAPASSPRAPACMSTGPPRRSWRRYNCSPAAALNASEAHPSLLGSIRS